MRKHGLVARLGGHPDGRQRLAEGPDLVRFDQDRVGDSFADAFGKNGRVGDEQVVTDQLNATRQAIGQHAPAGPVVFGHPVLDADDGIVADQVRQVLAELGTRHRAAFARQYIAPVAMEFRGCAIKSQADIPSRLIAGQANGIDNEIQRLPGGLHIGGEASFVADRGREALLIEQALEGMEDRRPGPQGIAEAIEAIGDDHALLEVQ